MNERTLRTLEYDKILEKAAAFAYSKNAKEAVKNIKPFTDAEDIKRALNETEEADIILFEHAINPSLNFDDVTQAIERAEILSMLSMGELLRIERVLRVARALQGQILNVPDERIVLLKQKASEIFTDKRLEDDIDKSIISDTEMSDNASTNLKNIRGKMKKIAENIKSKLLNYVNGSAYSKYMQDNIITVRNDRYVVPLKSEYKGIIPGLIHDQSASGATIYVEPMVIVELNNDLKTCMLEEAAEIDKILRAFTVRVGNEAEAIKSTFEIITDLDVIFAKAQYANATKSVKPVINKSGRIDIRKGRHPLIPAEKVVANDVRVGSDFNLLLITGPNTGGKTVCLKLTGLLVIMAMSGFFVPALYADIAVFDNVFCDIGDEQSIEQNLSTFSSHMKNTVNIINALTENTLVLFDELGAGTDPTEGAGLALNISRYVLSKGAKGVITTHYNELKEYAVVTDGVQNASMDFDPTTYSPTYKLIIGAPGASNALLIAEKLGLKKEIIDATRNGISGDKFEFENVLLSLEKSRKEAEVMLDEARKAKEKAQEELSAAKKEKEKLFAQRERLNVSVKKETKRLVDEAMDEANDIIQELRALLDDPDESTIFRAQKLRKSLKKYVINEENEFKGMSEEEDGDIAVGDRVLVISLNSEGEVVKLNPVKGEAKVKLGKIETNVKLDNLRRLKKTAKKAEKVKTAPTKMTLYNEQVSPEINLIGMNSEEALYSLEEYIDKCLRVHLGEIRIIHGYGEGILRKAVQNYLKGRKEIVSFRDGNFTEGGKGVTIAKF
ncbi:MAG: endonuclease MutS2 [Clostridiales bacterium]|nr:endonuclease MutS2 [Clostridiales bacterium]